MALTRSRPSRWRRPASKWVSSCGEGSNHPQSVNKRAGRQKQNSYQLILGLSRMALQQKLLLWKCAEKGEPNNSAQGAAGSELATHQRPTAAFAAPYLRIQELICLK